MSTNDPQPGPLTPQQHRARLTFDDARLLAECDVHLHRTRGPGGQHRNKVETAVRLVHRPSGLVATSSETRSQHENKARALHRLREAIAVEFRLPLSAPPELPGSLQIRGQTLHVRESNPAFFDVLAIALDAIDHHGGRVGDAAAALGVSTSSLTRFLADHPRAWAKLLDIRRAAGLPPLRAG